MKRRAWSPMCCLTCGDPLEEWKCPLEPGTYVACYRCARMYVVDVDGATLLPVLLQLEAPALQLVFDELLAAWWAKTGANRQLAVDVVGGTERKVA